MPATLYSHFGSTLQGMFVEWTHAPDDTDTALAETTLTATITLNLYNAALNTKSALTTADTDYNLVPYLTFLNTDSATMYDVVFDAWVAPLVLVTSTVDTINKLEVSTNPTFTAADWYATAWDTLTAEDTDQQTALTAIAAQACDVEVVIDTTYV